jgi:glycosyltransferase involved in cell wall biosynthesis/SAM-dependent methyltransferase
MISPGAERAGLHIVQVSYDTALLSCEVAEEPMQRQLKYARLLDARWPGARMSILVLTADRNSRPRVHDNLHVLPCAGSPIGRRLGVFGGLRRVHAAQPVDLVVLQHIFDESWIALVFAKLHGARVIAQDHWDITAPGADAVMLGGGFVAGLRKRLGWRALRYFTGVRVVNESARRALVDSRSHWRVECIPVPVTVPAATPQGEVATRPPLVLYVGRLAREKNVTFLLDVAARVLAQDPRARFRIVGEGPERANLEARAAELGLGARVEFTGAAPHAKLGEHYGAARILLLTSHVEGFGRVLVEAGASGLPAVAPEVGGVSDIIENGRTGLTFAPGALDEATAHVLRLLSDPDACASLGAAARERVRDKFDPEALATRWVDFMLGSLVRPMRQLLAPRPRTLRRYWEISNSPYSTLRALEYEAIRGTPLEGRTLDVGGGSKNSYWKLFDIRGAMESVNISADIEPTYVADLSVGIPVADEQYDTVISLNTFEHVYEDVRAIREAMRVLKRGGAFHIVIPYMYRVHASPSDYHRRTAMWWGRMLESCGVPPENYQVEALVWDRLATAYSFMGQGFLGRQVRRLVLLGAVVRDCTQWRKRRVNFTSRIGHDLECALGYYISGRK